MILENTKALGVTIEEAVILICILKENSLSVDQESYDVYMKSKATNEILSEYHRKIGENYARGRGRLCIFRGE